MFSFFTKDMGIDLGTANTLIYLTGKGIVINEPSVIAVESGNGKLIATGVRAKEMVGKAPESIKVVRPLQDGVISDFDMTAEMLRDFIGKALADRARSKLRVVVGVPSGVTEVEKRAVEEVVRQMGGKDVFVMEEPMAAAIGADLAVDDPMGCMIADIGGGTSDIAIIALGGIVTSTSLRHAGDKFDEAIIQYMRRKYNLLIGYKTAEELKVNVGCAIVDVNEEGFEVVRTMDARGRDAVTGLPKTVSVRSRDMQDALEEPIEIVIEGIKATLENAPPELAADIVTNGLVLSGGGGLISNLDKLIEMRTGMHVRVAENAFEAVALGTGKSLANMEKLKRYVRMRKDR
ncbi:MAG: rod shape-determining protein [Clostridiales bacterium]|nr:rod shape-determining protein [Clostridiales bacterium]